MSEDLNNVVPVNGLNDCIAQPLKDDAAATYSEQPSLNGVAHAPSPSNVESVVSSEDGNHVSAVASSIAPPSIDEAVQVDILDLNIAGPSRSSDNEVSENEIIREFIAFGTEPHLNEEIEKKVGYDRGLEADYIVGATEKDGKLMFLIKWRNSVDREADLLFATEVYEKSPQVAIKFFEERLHYILPSEKHN